MNAHRFESKQSTMKQLSLLITLIILGTVALAQETSSSLGKKVKVETLSGAIIKGELLESDDISMTIETKSGTTIVKKDKIALFTTYKDDESYESDTDDDSKNDKPKSKNYSGSHYLFNQSAYSLKKGQSYYENTYLFLNSFAFGITDNFSITTGFEGISLIIGQFPGVYVVPKYSIPFEGGAFAVSTSLYALQAGSSYGGLLQGIFTLGNLDRNISFGAGYAFSFGNDNTGYTINVSGILDVSKNISLITENYILAGEFSSETFITAGVRFHSKKNNNFLTVSLIRNNNFDSDLFFWPFFSGTVALK